MNISTTITITIKFPSNPPVGSIYTAMSSTASTWANGFNMPHPLYPSKTNVFNTVSTITMPVTMPNPEAKYKAGDVVMYRPTFEGEDKWAIIKITGFNAWLGYSIEVIKGTIGQSVTAHSNIYMLPMILEPYSNLHVPKYHKLWLAMNEE